MSAPNKEKSSDKESSTDFKLVAHNVEKSQSSYEYKGGSTLRVGSLLRTWADVSRINYMSAEPLDIIMSVSGRSIRRRSIGVTSKKCSIQYFVPTELRNKSDEDLFAEQMMEAENEGCPASLTDVAVSRVTLCHTRETCISREFPVNITSLLNEDQLWRCFYIFPELYDDVYSPTVQIRNIEDVADLVEGILTRDMVTACLSYLARTPILGDYVYIKLNLSSKHLVNIDVLKHYKFLVYLDLSSNLLTELSVLSHLPYLQYLSVAYNRLNTVLEYDTPQWFLTEVHYKYNSVKKIRDLDIFWSITILDLSHNNIKHITGLENLKYLRRLDLSFNHIQRLENLNHLRLLWLDLSYNNISSFELGDNTGLYTLLHLEYLNLNENNLTSFKIFSGCTRLQILHVRNNRLVTLLELAVYLRQMRRLIVLDLRGNPICSNPGYKDVVLNTFPGMLNLDEEELDPVEQRTIKMNMTPDVTTFATRRLLRLLYIEQLSRALVSPNVPPADTSEVPIVVLVGYEAVGKGKLARRLAAQCKSNIELAVQHTTATFHLPDHYRPVTRAKFDDMLLAGEFLTYTEMNGESYGLSREESFINEGKVKVVAMDLIGGLMLRLRGRRPYLILCTCSDKEALRARQTQRKIFREVAYQKIVSEGPFEKSTLQVLLSGRIIITGILNEIIMTLPEEKEQSEFVIESECSLMMDSEARHAATDYSRGVNLYSLYIYSSSSSMDEPDKSSQMDQSLHSLYNDAENSSGSNLTKRQSRSTTKDKNSSLYNPKNVDFRKYTSSTWKGPPDSTKSSKSVTFTSTSRDNAAEPTPDMTGLLIEPPLAETEAQNTKRSISMPQWRKTALPNQSILNSGSSTDDTDLWLAFLVENGLITIASTIQDSNTPPGTSKIFDTKVDDPELILKEMQQYQKDITGKTNYSYAIKDDYEELHRLSPGLFWNTVEMDDPDKAFKKLIRIIKDILSRQPNLAPMFDIDFAAMSECHIIQKKLAKIRSQIAPQRLFY